MPDITFAYSVHLPNLPCNNFMENQIKTNQVKSKQWRDVILIILELTGILGNPGEFFGAVLPFCFAHFCWRSASHPGSAKIQCP